MNFASTWHKLLKHCISVELLSLEVYVLGVLRKELYIAPSIERFETAILGRSC